MRSVHLVVLVAVGLSACVAHRYEVEPDVPGPSPSFRWTVIPEELSTGLVKTEDLYVHCKYNGSGDPKYMALGRICEPYGPTVILAFMKERGGGAVQVTDAATENMQINGNIPEKFFTMHVSKPNSSDACVYACQAQINKKHFWDYVDVHEVGTTVEELAYLVQKNAWDIKGGGDITVRLLYLEDDRYGAVEVTRQTEFDDPESVESGLLCDDDFDDDHHGPTVVCRMLGFHSGTFLKTEGFFNATTEYEGGDFVLDNVECRGTETNLAECSSNEWGQENCDLESEVAGVLCSMDDDVISNYSVRLVGGENDTYGVVVVTRTVHSSRHTAIQSGLLCNHEFDENNLGPTVVCRMLGFDLGEYIQPDFFFDYHYYGYFALDNVRCLGNETNLDECPSNVWGDTDCDWPDDAAGVRCFMEEVPPEEEYMVRLVGGGSHYGLLEVDKCCGYEFGLVCSDTFSDNDRGATVVCKMLNFTRGRYMHVEYNVTDRDIFWLDDVMCRGNETNLADCPALPWGTYPGYDCSTAAGVNCTLDGYLVRLLGGNDSVGLVEVTRQLGPDPSTRESGLVCDDHFDTNDRGATVVCRMLGFNSGIFIDGDNFKPAGYAGDIELDNVKCSGIESNLADCRTRPWGAEDCSVHSELAAVQCSMDPWSIGIGYTVRLIGGDNTTYGAIEVIHEIGGVNETGLLCDDWFDQNDRGAQVVCRMLGFDSGVFLDGDSYARNYPGDFVLDNVNCLGVEDNLAGCWHAGWGVGSCNLNSEVAGVRCDGGDGGDGGDGDEGCVGECTGGCSPVSASCYSVELFGGDDHTYGAVNVTRMSEDGTVFQSGLVCDDYFDMNDRGPTVICRMLGFNSGTFTDPGSFVNGYGGLDIELDDVRCLGTESNLAQCVARGPWGNEGCGLTETAGVRCSMDLPPVWIHNYTVQLVGGINSNYGAVEVSRTDDTTGVTESGLVCDDGFNSNSAGVVCRMLGYDHGAFVDGDAYAPSNFTGQFALDDVTCLHGNETNIGHCWNRGWGVENCGKTEVAGVQCWNNGQTIVDDGSKHSHHSDDKSHPKGLKKMKGHNKEKKIKSKH